MLPEVARLEIPRKCTFHPVENSKKGSPNDDKPASWIAAPLGVFRELSIFLNTIQANDVAFKGLVYKRMCCIYGF
jgi:hypothetical protein